LFFIKKLYIFVNMLNIIDKNIKDNSRIIALENVDSNGKLLIIKGKEYRIYTSFETDKMASGFGIVVYCEDNEFHTIDSDYFDTTKKIDIKKFKI